MFPEVKKF